MLNNIYYTSTAAVLCVIKCALCTFKLSAIVLHGVCQRVCVARDVVFN